MLKILGLHSDVAFNLCNVVFTFTWFSLFLKFIILNIDLFGGSKKKHNVKGGGCGRVARSLKYEHGMILKPKSLVGLCIKFLKIT